MLNRPGLEIQLTTDILSKNLEGVRMVTECILARQHQENAPSLLATDGSNRTFLHLALENDVDEIALFLFSKLNDEQKIQLLHASDNSGKTILMLAACTPSADFFKFYVEKYANHASEFINEKDHTHNTALHHALQSQAPTTTLATLINLGASLEAHNDAYQTPFSILAYQLGINNTEVDQKTRDDIFYKKQIEKQIAFFALLNNEKKQALLKLYREELLQSETNVYLKELYLKCCALHNLKTLMLANYEFNSTEKHFITGKNNDTNIPASSLDFLPDSFKHKLFKFERDNDFERTDVSAAEIDKAAIIENDAQTLTDLIQHNTDQIQAFKKKPPRFNWKPALLISGLVFSILLIVASITIPLLPGSVFVFLALTFPALNINILALSVMGALMVTGLVGVMFTGDELRTTPADLTPTVSINELKSTTTQLRGKLLTKLNHEKTDLNQLPIEQEDITKLEMKISELESGSDKPVKTVNDTLKDINTILASTLNTVKKTRKPFTSYLSMYATTDSDSTSSDYVVIDVDHKTSLLDKNIVYQ